MEVNTDVHGTDKEPPSETARAQLNVVSETVTFQRDAPPPYSLHDNAVPSPPILYQPVITQPPLRDRPVFYNCMKCGGRVLTKVEYSSTQKTHLLAGFICGLTLFCAMCCLGILPYVTKKFKMANHFCPNCSTFLGSYSRI